MRKPDRLKQPSVLVEGKAIVKNASELCLADFSVTNDTNLHGRQLSATICIFTKRRLIDTQFVTIYKHITFKKSYYLPSDQSFLLFVYSNCPPEKDLSFRMHAQSNESLCKDCTQYGHDYMERATNHLTYAFSANHMLAPSRLLPGRIKESVTRTLCVTRGS